MSEESILFKVYYGFRILQSLIAIAFNLVTLTCVLRYKYLRTAANLLVWSIALTDLLHGLATVMVLPLRFLPLPWPAQTTICISGLTTEIISVMTELVSFALLAMERWNSLLAQLNRRKQWSLRRVFVVTVVCWVCVCSWNIGVAVFKDKRPSEGTSCVAFLYFPPYFVYIGVSVFFVATPIIAFFYARIAFIVRSSANQVAPAGPVMTITQQRMKKDLIITKMMAKVVGLFFLLYCPFFFIVFFISDTSPTWLRVLYYVSILLYDVNFWINPIIYAWSNKKFSKAFEDLLPRVITNLWRPPVAPMTSALAENLAVTSRNDPLQAGPSGTSRLELPSTKKTETSKTTEIIVASRNSDIVEPED